MFKSSLIECSNLILVRIFTAFERDILLKQRLLGSSFWSAIVITRNSEFFISLRCFILISRHSTTLRLVNWLIYFASFINSFIHSKNWKIWCWQCNNNNTKIIYLAFWCLADQAPDQISFVTGNVDYQSNFLGFTTMHKKASKNHQQKSKIKKKLILNMKLLFLRGITL